jgi:hypothetical protein
MVKCHRRRRSCWKEQGRTAMGRMAAVEKVVHHAWPHGACAIDSKKNMVRNISRVKKCTVTSDECSGKPNRGDLRTHQSRPVTARFRSDRSILCLINRPIRSDVFPCRSCRDSLAGWNLLWTVCFHFNFHG